MVEDPTVAHIIAEQIIVTLKSVKCNMSHKNPINKTKMKKSIKAYTIKFPNVFKISLLTTF